MPRLILWLIWQVTIYYYRIIRRLVASDYPFGVWNRVSNVCPILFSQSYIDNSFRLVAQLDSIPQNDNCIRQSLSVRQISDIVAATEFGCKKTIKTNYEGMWFVYCFYKINTIFMKNDNALCVCYNDSMINICADLLSRRDSVDLAATTPFPYHYTAFNQNCS